MLSGVLNDAITSYQQPTDQGAEAAKLTICMREEDALSFEIILNWTITHTFTNRETEGAYFYTRVLEAYFLADRLDMPVICYAIIAELKERAPRGFTDCHGFVYANTVPSSPLRAMLVDMAVNDPRVPGVFQKGPLYSVHSKSFQSILLFFFFFKAFKKNF